MKPVIVIFVQSILRASPSPTGMARRTLPAGTSLQATSFHELGGNVWAYVKDGEWILCQAGDGTKYAEVIPPSPEKRDEAATLLAAWEILARIWRAK
jgi:hypothetical protein